MKIQTVTERKLSLLVAGALALFSQGALSGDASAARSEPEELTVTAPRPQIELANPVIEFDASELIEALNRRLAKDLEKSLDAISKSRIELAISEVTTRG